MHPIAIEEQWRTQRWPNRIFQFLLGVTEVNFNFLIASYFGSELKEQVPFRYKLGNELVNNPYGTAIGESKEEKRSDRDQ